MDMTLRPMLPAERNYCYSQSQQISMQTGLIGYLRADMGSNGKGFFSTWNDFRADLKSEDFKLEFDDIINNLRKEGNFLHDRSTLFQCCYRTPDSSFRNDRNEYGFRVDTDHYSYMMRLNPNKGEYNLYCYCYVRQWLDRHLHHAEKGIRFITPDYKEIFRIQDGDKVRITLSTDETLDRVCRYIDDYHVEVGRNLYHICEFSERMVQCGNTVIPLRSSLPEKCFSVLPSTGELIYLSRGEKGYQPSKVSFAGEEGRSYADHMNQNSGVSKAQEAAMLAGSMFGWEKPAADPKNYDENGIPILPKQKDRGDAR
ncbi:MAG: hypothetical protein ACI3W5_07940 [Faecousia sp.]